MKKIDTTNLTLRQLLSLGNHKIFMIFLSLFLVSVICGFLLYLMKQYIIKDYNFESFFTSAFISFIIIIFALFPKILVTLLASAKGVSCEIIMIVVIEIICMILNKYYNV